MISNMYPKIKAVPMSLFADYADTDYCRLLNCRLPIPIPIMRPMVVEDSIICRNLQKILKSVHGWPHNHDFSEPGKSANF